MCRRPCNGQDDEVRDNRYQFVGEGRGGYMIEQEVVWVGEGQGAFDMQSRSVWFQEVCDSFKNNCNRECFLKIMYASVMVMTLLCLVFGVALLFPGVSGKLNSALPMHGSHSRTKHPTNGSRGMQNVLLGSQTTSASKPYDCKVSAELSSEKTSWCCFHERLLCQGAGSGQAAAHGCDTVCVLNGLYKPCRQRIKFAATHQFAGQQGSCTSAWNQVSKECSSCRSCSLAQSGCELYVRSMTPHPVDPQPVAPHPVAHRDGAYCDISHCHSWTDDQRQWCNSIVGNICSASSIAG